MCWQLDPTEGPCRERRRLMQVPRSIDDKYVLDEGVKSTQKGSHCTVNDHSISYQPSLNNSSMNIHTDGYIFLTV